MHCCCCYRIVLYRIVLNDEVLTDAILCAPLVACCCRVRTVELGKASKNIQAPSEAGAVKRASMTSGGGSKGALGTK